MQPSSQQEHVASTTTL